MQKIRTASLLVRQPLLARLIGIEAALGRHFLTSFGHLRSNPLWSSASMKKTKFIISFHSRLFSLSHYPHVVVRAYRRALKQKVPIGDFSLLARLIGIEPTTTRRRRPVLYPLSYKRIQGCIGIFYISIHRI